MRGNVLGSYVHGLFESGNLAEKLIDLLLRQKGLDGGETLTLSYAEYKNQQYDALADAVRVSVDLQKIYEILEAGV